MSLPWSAAGPSLEATSPAECPALTSSHPALPKLKSCPGSQLAEASMP